MQHGSVTEAMSRYGLNRNKSIQNQYSSNDNLQVGDGDLSGGEELVEPVRRGEGVGRTSAMQYGKRTMQLWE